MVFFCHKRGGDGGKADGQAEKADHCQAGGGGIAARAGEAVRRVGRHHPPGAAKRPQNVAKGRTEKGAEHRRRAGPYGRAERGGLQAAGRIPGSPGRPGEDRAGGAFAAGHHHGHFD